MTLAEQELNNLGIRLHEDEKILISAKPHPSTAWYWLISRVWHVVFFVILIVFVFANRSNNNIDNQGISYMSHLLHGQLWLIIIVIIALLIAGFYWFKSVVKAYDYIVTNQRCILRYGLLGLNTRMIPFSQIVDVNIRSSFFERLFGLASVRIDCIGTMMNYYRQRSAGNNTTRMEGLTLKQSQEVLTIISEQLQQLNK